MSALYLDHFGLGEAPFSITPNPQFFFAGSGRGSLLQALRYALQSEEGIVTVIGEVGSGKTMLCRMLLDDLPAGVDAIYLANPSFSRNEILDAIAHDLGVDTGSAPTRLDALNAELIRRHAAGRRVVLLIDEAHAMPRDSLEEVRLLSNLETSRHKLLNIVLFGQPELHALLQQRDLRQLRERVVQRFELGPLPSRELRDYLAFRLQTAGYRGALPFSPAALALINRCAAGITRRINILADKALLSAFARNVHLAELDDVRRAVRDAGIEPGGDPRWRQLAIAAGLLLALLGAFAAGRWLQPAPGPLAVAVLPDAAAARSATALAEPAAAPPGQPAAPSADPAAAPPDAAAPPAAPVASAVAAAGSAGVSAATVPAAAEVAFDAWLQGSGGAYTLQIATLRGGPRERLLREADELAARLGADSLRLQRLGSDVAPSFVVFHGDFASAEAALQAMSHLPENVRNNQPIVRSRRALRPGESPPQ